MSLIEESYIIKESEIKSRSRYDQFISSKYAAVSQLKVHKCSREPSRILVHGKQLECTLETNPKEKGNHCEYMSKKKKKDRIEKRIDEN